MSRRRSTPKRTTDALALGYCPHGCSQPIFKVTAGPLVSAFVRERSEADGWVNTWTAPQSIDRATFPTIYKDDAGNVTEVVDLGLRAICRHHPDAIFCFAEADVRSAVANFNGSTQSLVGMPVDVAQR